MKNLSLVMVLVVAMLVSAFGSVSVVSAQGLALCTASINNVGTPLIDMPANQIYKGDPSANGGLYHTGSNTHPNLNQGLDVISQIQPLDTNGNPSDNGRIVVLAVGMSNTNQEFDQFQHDFNKIKNGPDPFINPRVVLVNGAQGGQAADDWAVSPNGEIWDNIEHKLGNAGVTKNQIQVIWLKQSERFVEPFPIMANKLTADLKTLVKYFYTTGTQAHMPNLKIVFLSSRTRSHTNTGVSPEPMAYEYGFSTKWLIRDQMNNNGINYTNAPFLAWGPYLWIDGNNPRSDGLVWPSARLRSDCTHPSLEIQNGDSSGTVAVSKMLMDFFSSHELAAPWFSADGGGGGGGNQDKPGDYNNDGQVNLADYILVVEQFVLANFDIFDLNNVTSFWGSN